MTRGDKTKIMYLWVESRRLAMSPFGDEVLRQECKELGLDINTGKFRKKKGK
jgi:hypothetical protein